MRLKTNGKRVLSLVLCVMFVLSSMVFTVSTSAKTATNYNVPKAVSPVTVDGVINPEEWKNALEIDVATDLTRWMKGGSNTLEGGTIHMMWDDEYLYMAFDIEDTSKGKGQNLDGIELLIMNSAEDAYGVCAKIDFKVDRYGAGKTYIYESHEAMQGNLGSYGVIDPSTTMPTVCSDFYTAETTNGYTIETSLPWTLFADFVQRKVLTTSYTGEVGTQIYAQINVWDEDANGGQDWWLMNTGASDELKRGSGEDASIFTLTETEAGTEKTTADGPYFIPKTETPPTIDGEIDIYEEWVSAEEVSLNNDALKWLEDKVPSAENGDSCAFMMWDKNYLYIAYDILDATASNIPESIETLSYTDEIFLAIFNNAETSEYKGLEMVASLQDTGEAAYVWNNNPTVNGSEKIAGVRNGSAYSIEIAIPWSAIGVEGAFGAEIYMNQILSDVDAEANVQRVGYTGDLGEGEAARDAYILTNAIAGVEVVVVPENQHSVPETKSPINLDGTIEDDEWQNALTLNWKDEADMAKYPEGDCILSGPDANNDYNVITKMMWDKDHLYIAYDVTDHTISESATQQFVGFAIYGQDGLAGLERDTLDLNISIDGDGNITLSDDPLLLLGDTTTYYRAAGKLTENGYQIEIEIDWTMFSTAADMERLAGSATYFYTGRYTGRVGTKLPIWLSTCDSYTNEEGGAQYGWYQYHTDSASSGWPKKGMNSDIFLLTDDVAGRPEGYKPPEKTEIIEVPANRYDIPKATGTITVDGSIDLTTEWKDALVLDLSYSEDNKAIYNLLGANNDSLGDSKVYLLWDADKLYMAFDIKDATNTGSYAKVGGGTDKNDVISVYFFGGKTSSDNAEALSFSLYPYLSDNKAAGVFENNINGKSNLILKRKVPSASSIMGNTAPTTTDYNFQFEIAIPWTFFKTLSEAGEKNANYKFTNYPTGVAGTIFSMCAGYTDSNADGKASYIMHTYYGEKGWPRKYTTMDQFRLYEPSLDEHDLTHYEAVDATCEEGGNVEYWVCSEDHCGKTFVEVDGVKVEAVANTVFRSALSHNYETKYDATGHWTECEHCHDTTDKEDHVFGEFTTTKDPEIGVPGSKERYCTCEYKDVVEIPALVDGHTLEHVERKEAACGEDGNIEYWYCTDDGCGKYFSDADATNEITLADTVLTALEHNYETKYDEAGHWTECEYCGDTTDKVDHEFGEFTTTKDPEMGIAGSKERSCECGYKDVQEIPALPVQEIAIESTEAAPGKEFTVYVNLKNNPGIVSLRFQVEWDPSVLELVKVEDLGALKGWTEPVEDINSPYILRWADALVRENNTTSEKIVALTFKLSEDAEIGDQYDIWITPIQSYATVSDTEGKEVQWIGGKAKVNCVKGYTIGDLNDDGKINAADEMLLTRYLANWAGYESRINLDAADINKDGKINAADYMMLQRHLANWPGYEILG